MAVVNELIRKEEDGTLSFGNYSLEKKSKVEEFEHEGDLYKVKTFSGITKLEKNGMFVYESVPGTAVFNMRMTDQEANFDVVAVDTAQISLGLEAQKEYEIIKDDMVIGKIKTNLGGKLVLSIERCREEKANIKVVKI